MKEYAPSARLLHGTRSPFDRYNPGSAHARAVAAINFHWYPIVRNYSFTSGFRDVLDSAGRQAAELGHAYLAAEHIALAMLHDARVHPLAEVLAALGVQPVALAAAIRATLPIGTAMPLGEIPYMPEARRAVERAMRFSSEIGDTEVGAEHLLVGLVESASGQLEEVLLAADLEAARVRSVVESLCGHGPRFV